MTDLPAGLLQQTFLAGGEFHYELNSTSTRALEVGAGDIPLPYLIWAEQQAAGRGRGHNIWWAGPGALTFTILLSPQSLGIAPAQWPGLSLCVGTAICQFLQRMQIPDVRLKWPNDVYLSSRKVCGVLIESVACRPDRLAIGIGINVNNSLLNAPPEIQQRATSLVDVLSTTHSLVPFLTGLLQELDSVLTLFGRAPKEFPPLWRDLCWLTGRQVRMTDVRGSVTGTVLGIADDGALRVRLPEGESRFVSGTVEPLSA